MPRPTTETTWTLAGAAVVFSVSAVLLLRLGAAPIRTAAEQRVYDVVRHMRESGDLLVPVRNGKIRLQKPPLYYWQAYAAGEALRDFDRRALRLPSALAGIALLAITWFLARAVAGPGVAALSTAFLGTMFLFLTQGREGTAEMTLALWSTAALCAYAAAQRRGRRWLVGFALALGMALLAKATAALLVVLLPIAVDLVARRDGRFARERGLWIAIAGALLIGVSWYAAILLVVPGAPRMLLNALVMPLGVDTGTAAHYRGVFWYFSKTVAAALPALLVLPLILVAAWRRGREKSGVRREGGPFELARFCRTVVIAVFVGFSLLPQKQKHYLLPLLPFLAVVLAVETAWVAVRAEALLRRYVAWVASLVAAAGIAACAVFFLFFRWIATVDGLDRVSAWAALGCAVTALVAGAAAALRGRPRRFVGLATPAVLILLAIDHAFVEPWRDAISVASEQGTPLPDEKRLLDVAGRHPWFARVVNVDEKIARCLRVLERTGDATHGG